MPDKAHTHRYVPHTNPAWRTHSVCTVCGFAAPTATIKAAGLEKKYMVVVFLGGPGAPRVHGHYCSLEEAKVGKAQCEEDWAWDCRAEIKEVT